MNVAYMGLGLVPTGKRTVTPVPAHLLALVPAPSGNNETVKGSNADPIKDTVPLIQRLTKRQAWQGKKLAKALKGKTVEETVRNNWDFMFNHIEYVKDPVGRETVRSLRRLVHEGKGDCDCFVNGLNNLLYNQGIRNAKMRVASYNNSSDPSHIYIVVPGNNRHITLDPVVHKFNYEVPFTDKQDFPMTLESLDGFGECAPSASSCSTPTTSLNVPSKMLSCMGMMKTSDILIKNNIPFTESTVNGAIVYRISTPTGPKDLPGFTKMSDEQALLSSIKTAMNAVATTDTTLTTNQNKQAKKVLLGLLVFLVGADLLRGNQNKALV